MKLHLVKGTTSQTALIFVQDSSATDGSGLTGLVYNSSGLKWYYYREAQGTGGTAVTLATMTLGTWATGGFVEVDSTNMPGWYEIGIPNAALASGADFVGLVLHGATNMAPVTVEIQLTDFDMNEGVRGALTALPNAAAGAAGGIGDIVRVSGDSTAADNLELDYDGTGYTKANSTVGTVTTNTDMRGTDSALLAASAPSNFSALLINVSGHVSRVTLVDTTTTNTDMRGTDSAATATALSTHDGKLDTVDTNVDTLLARITSTLFSGITSLAEWLGLIAGKQTGDTTARTELRATGAGSGTYDETTDSQEALRDRGDASWATATGFSTHNAADVWTSGTRTLTANTNLNDPTAAAIADAVWDEAQTGHTTAGTFGKYLDTEVSGVGGGSAASIADAVWEEILADHSGTTGSTAEALASVSAPASQTELDGICFSADGTTYFWTASLRVDGSVVTSGLSSPAVVGAYGNNGETDLSFSESTAAAVGSNHSLYGSGTLGTTPTAGVPWFLEVTVVYGGTTYRGRLDVGNEA